MQFLSPVNTQQLLNIEENHWWPAAGYRNNNSATMTNVATNGWYWSSSPHPSYANQSYNLYFDYNGNVNPSNNNNRSYGFSLRCIQDFTTDTFYIIISPHKGTI